MQSLKAGINKVVCSVESRNTSGTIILSDSDKYIIMTCDPPLKFKHGEEAILRPQRGHQHKVGTETFIIVDAEDILMTLSE